MQNHSVFVAVVITSNAGSGAVTVARESYGGSENANVGMNLQGVVVSQTMANYLGFKESLLPQPGSRVLCVENTATSCYIVGVIPWENAGISEMPARTTVGQGSALAEASNRVGHQKYTPLIFDNSKSGDVVDGEHVIFNEFGVLLGLFQQFATLKASELAQIQCHLLDDLVRIVSHNYQHFTALGEFNITHDGRRIMAEFGATHKTVEIYGDNATTSDKGKKPQFKKDGDDSVDDSSDYFKVSEDQQKKATERFKLFLGSIGDFLNLFIVRPAESEGKPEAGLANIHAGVDGGLHIRSAKEVFIEKTNWIRVPNRVTRPEDPSGDDGESLTYEEKKRFIFNDEVKNRHALQLRDYVAYVNQKLNYQNFKSQAKDFLVNDSIEDEFTLNEKTKLDQEFKEAGVNLGGTAGIYLMPNGGITIRDAFNSAIIMEDGNVYIQAAKNMFAQPSKDCVFKVGQSFSLAAKAHIDLSSTTGGLRLKSTQAMYLYSLGGLVLHGNSGTSAPFVPEQDPELYGRQVYQFLNEDFEIEEKEQKPPIPEHLALVPGVVVKTNGGIYNFSGSILNQTGNIFNQVGGQVNTTAAAIIDLALAQHVTVSKGFGLNYFQGDWFTIADGNAGLSGKTLSLGKYKKPINVMGSVLKGVIKTGAWKKKSKICEFIKSRLDLLEYTAYKKRGPEKIYPAQFLRFRWPKSEHYNFELKQDPMQQTIFQQAKQRGTSGWGEQGVNSSLPYPGLQVWPSYLLKTPTLNLANLPPSKWGTSVNFFNPPKYETAGAGEKPGPFELSSVSAYPVLGQDARIGKGPAAPPEEEEEEKDPCDFCGASACDFSDT